MFKPKIGMKLKLRGKTRKGKNRVHEHGEVWEIRCDCPTVEPIKDSVLFDNRRGPWLHIEPVTSKHPTALRGHAGRWVHAWEDRDFHVEEIKNAC